MEKYYLEFDDSDENKLIYTSIFNEYVSCFTQLVNFHANIPLFWTWLYSEFVTSVKNGLSQQEGYANIYLIYSFWPKSVEVNLLNRLIFNHAHFCCFVEIDLLEKHLEQQLTERIPGFNMNKFNDLVM